MNEYVQEVGLTILEIAARYHGRRFLEFLQLLSGQNAVVIIWTGLRGTIMSDFKVFFFLAHKIIATAVVYMMMQAG
jgi:hypothetical protein